MLIVLCLTLVRKDALHKANSFISLVLVEGFSNVKKCSNEARALMQLDCGQFVMKLEKVCQTKPLPHQDHVIQYIQAFYIMEVKLENWVKYHTGTQSNQKSYSKPIYSIYCFLAVFSQTIGIIS